MLPFGTTWRWLPTSPDPREPRRHTGRKRASGALGEGSLCLCVCRGIRPVGEAATEGSRFHLSEPRLALALRSAALPGWTVSFPGTGLLLPGT